jgi:hypothetical protein
MRALDFIGQNEVFLISLKISFQIAGWVDLPKGV